MGLVDAPIHKRMERSVRNSAFADETWALG